jgi:hypothetical protein
LKGDKHTLEELEKIRVDCMYGKKKHYNARDRYSRYHKRMGIAIVSLTALMGTSLFYTFSESELLFARIATGILTVMVAVFATLQTFFNFEKRALRHKMTADKYVSAMKKSQRLTSYYKDGNKTIDEVEKEIETLSQEIKYVQEDEPEVSPEDYHKARSGVKNGEEIYTDLEKKT